MMATLLLAKWEGVMIDRNVDEQFERLYRLAQQQLESLHRAGITDLMRDESWITSPPEVSATEPPSRSSVDHTVPLSRPLALPSRIDAPHLAMSGPHTLEQESKPVTKAVNQTQLPLAQRETELAVIRNEVAACRRCEHLACKRTQTVFGVGNVGARLCFIGEAPGADEDRKGEPFVGRAGQLLTDMIQKGMGLQRSDVYILNILKCRPPDNRTPTDDEIEHCREYFERQLAVLQPEFICCLGATAVKGLLRQTQTLGRMRGKWFNYRGAKVIVTYHPSYLLRNPAAKKDTWDDLQMLMREMGLPVRSRE
jgi:DNA polymerase